MRWDGGAWHLRRPPRAGEGVAISHVYYLG